MSRETVLNACKTEDMMDKSHKGEVSNFKSKHYKIDSFLDTKLKETAMKTGVSEGTLIRAMIRWAAHQLDKETV